MARPTLLAGDMGGTKTLLALYDLGETLIKRHQQRFVSADWSSLEPMLQAFVEERPKDVRAPTHGCIAVAGLFAIGRRIATSPGSSREGSGCRREMQQLELVNDFGVLIYGLPHFGADQQVVLQESQDDGPGHPWAGPASAWLGRSHQQRADSSLPRGWTSRIRTAQR